MFFAMKRYNNAGVHGWDRLQKEYECCGVYSYKDWKNTTFGESGNSKVDDLN